MAEPRKALRGRFVRKQICQSKDVADLIRERGPWAGLLFERMILWADDDGRLIAEPQVIKANCLPWHSRAKAHVSADIEAMHRMGLIVMYRSSSTLYCYFPNWQKHQPKRTERYIPSELPAPPTGCPVGAESVPVRTEEAVSVSVAVSESEAVIDIAPKKPAPPGWKECLAAYSDGYCATVGEKPVLDRGRNSVDFVRLKAMLLTIRKLAEEANEGRAEADREDPEQSWRKLEAVIAFAVSGNDPDWPGENGLPSLQTICCKHHYNRIQALLATRARRRT